MYDANHLIYPSPVGYDIRNKNGEIGLWKFLNTMDYSLELIKLREVFKKTYGKTPFSFWLDGKEYSQAVINVSFKYSYKLWNQHAWWDEEGKKCQSYVKAGYRFEDLKFHDCLAFMGDELVGVMVDIPVNVPVSDTALTKWFEFDRETHSYRIRKSRNAKALMTRKELRENLYENGFYCDGKKYVRFKRSSGSSRVGKCLFIQEEMYQRMKNWERCGISMRSGTMLDLAGWEAYIALTLSSLVDTMELKPENILLIEDYDSTFKDEMMAVGLENGQLTVEPKVTEISNCIWDGQSLLDKSMFGKYQDRGMLLLRARFFKSACFNTNIQQFFRDNGITDVSQLKGKTRAKKLEDIKLITTPSSVKYLKFGSWDQWLDNLEPTFGIVKFEKPTHFFDGDLVQTHYQLLNTLHMSREEVRELLAESADYFRQMDDNPAVFRYYVGCQCGNESPKLEFNGLNDILYYFTAHNKWFHRTKMYHEWKQDILQSFKKNVRKGHILVRGTYATLFGNPYEMLQAAIGRFDGTSLLGQGNVWCRMFADGEEILGSRSPHVAVGNILLARNVRHEYLDRYFNLSPEIVCINSIEENILERLSGADYDSDTMLVTSNPLLVRKAKEHYDHFLVPTKLVPAAMKKRRYDNRGKAELDHDTSDNRIGEIVNLSQELNTLYWHKLNNGASFEDVADIYKEVAKLDVLSNIEIDSAKREYAVDTKREISRIRRKYQRRTDDGKRIKPLFFSHVFSRYRDTNRNAYTAHDTTMDYLQEEVNWRVATVRISPLDKRKYVPLCEIFHLKWYRERNVRHDQIERLLKILEESRRVIADHWAHYGQEEDKNRKKVYMERIHGAIERQTRLIQRLDITQSSLLWLMHHIEEKQYRKIRRAFMKLFFGHPTENFRRFLLETTTGVTYLERYEYGPMEIYGLPFEEVDASCE